MDAGRETGTTIGEGEGETGTTIGEGEGETGTTIGEGEGETGTTPPSDPGAWPKTVTLAAQGIGVLGEHVRFSDGAVSDAGDLGVHALRHVSLQSPVDGSICEMGTSFAGLADIPVDVAACPQWTSIAHLSATTVHESDESYRIGLGLLVWDAEHAALYRLRVLGDSHDAAARSTATFEYEPAR
ncbi:uncharacterized protein SOCEGT47_027920 [Sorangium cellulosum]|uniref:Uncharacterized protein n=1 Tax=Sorangium cellulosum TaxID=56 RepID=A0A4P2PZV7_SORCE|nr:hypothetical protein [Sorangium cellulosum]AUX22291.1 uncharacterized protein SOCEGT47_027920 [Sorangium cellulosum]